MTGNELLFFHLTIPATIPKTTLTTTNNIIIVVVIISHQNVPAITKVQATLGNTTKWGQDAERNNSSFFLEQHDSAADTTKQQQQPVSVYFFSFPFQEKACQNLNITDMDLNFRLKKDTSIFSLLLCFPLFSFHFFPRNNYSKESTKQIRKKATKNTP